MFWLVGVLVGVINMVVGIEDGNTPYALMSAAYTLTCMRLTTLES